MKINDKIREIVSALYRFSGQMSAHEISKKTGISYLTVQRYLKILEENGIVHRWKEISNKKKYTGRGQTIRYSISHEIIEKVDN